MGHPKRHGIRLKSLFLWHRYMGLAAALFVLIMASSGLLLNHTSELALDKRHLTSDLLLDWYGVPRQFPSRSFAAGGHWLSQVDEHLFLDGRRLPGATPPLLGALDFQDMIVAATGEGLLLLTPAGEVVERLDTAHGLPCAPYALGKTGQNSLVISCNDGQIKESEDLVTWADTSSGATWAQPSTPPAGIIGQANARARHTVLSTERALLDLHSGRLFGAAGVYVFDLAGILMLLLACTGFWHWAKRKRK